MENAPRYKEDEATSWLWAGCWLLFIYVTIPLARPIQEFVRDHGGKSLFLIATFAAFAVAAVFLIRSAWRGALSCRPAGMVVLGAILGLFCSMTWGLRANPEESLHFVQYGVLSILLFRALHHRVRDPSIYIAAAMLGSMFGILDELIQWMVPRRFFDYRDIGINVTAVLLVQLAIAMGIRPSTVRWPCSRFGARIAFAAAGMNVVLLLFCVSNTDSFKAWYSGFVPAAAKIDEVTATYGFRISDPDIGVFYSQLRPDELRRQDRERATEVAAILDEYKPERRYERILRAYPAYVDPFLVEARVHLFRRDRHGSLAIKKAGDPAAALEHVRVAYRENQILRAYFPETLARSSYAWEPHIEQVIVSMIGDPPLYDSPVSRYVITRFTKPQLVSVLVTLFVLLGVGYRWTMKRLVS